MSETVSVTVDGDVAVVRIDNPKVNALSIAVLEELRDAFEGLATDRVGAVVVWGGERIFAAGADVSEFADDSRKHLVTGAFSVAFRALATLPCLSVAAVAGVAFGGGCELALACDFRVAARSARFAQPEILLGLFPGAGGTQRLVRTVGLARARDLILTGRHVSGEEAERIGLVDRLVEGEVLYDEALSFAHELAAGPRQAQLAAKRAIEAALDVPLSEGLALERELFGEVLLSADAQTGVSSFLTDGPGKATFGGK